MSITHQSAMPPRSVSARRTPALLLVPTPRRGVALVKIVGLVSLTAVVAALAAGTAFVALILLAASLGR